MRLINAALVQLSTGDLSSDESLYTGNREFDEALFKEAKNMAENKPFDDLTKLYSIKWNETINGERITSFDGINSGSPGPLANVLFQVEVKTLAGNNKDTKSQVAYYYAEDFDWTTPYQPTLDITEMIQVLGDIYSEDQDDVRTYTTFRMLADYETIIQKAYDDTMKKVNSEILNENRLFSDVEVDKCSQYTNFAAEEQYYSDAQKASKRAAWEAELADKLQDFSADYSVFDE